MTTNKKIPVIKVGELTYVWTTNAKRDELSCSEDGVVTRQLRTKSVSYPFAMIGAPAGAEHFGDDRCTVAECEAKGVAGIYIYRDPEIAPPESCRAEEQEPTVLSLIKLQQ